MPWAKIIPILFAVTIIVNGIVDLARPEPLRAAMDALSMPHYMLWILGFAKVAGGVTILVARDRLIAEWAFAGFFIWAFGGLASHTFSGHPPQEFLPLFLLTTFLIVSYVANKRGTNGAATE